MECPNCGCDSPEYVTKNSSGQILCDSCGYDETVDGEEEEE